MFKVLAGNLSAVFSLDGNQLDQYLKRKTAIVKSIYEELILHDQILIPTQDYSTACGLILILGERNFISLMEQRKLHFLRLRGIFCYFKGTGVDGTLLTFQDPDLKKPQTSSIEESIDAGLSMINGQLKEKSKIADLLLEESTSLEMSEILGAIKSDAFEDLKRTSMWKDKYCLSDENLLALPGMQDMQARLIGPKMNPHNDSVDALLTLALFNIELYLSSIFQCSSNSTGSPLGDLIDIKLDRLLGKSIRSKNMWSLLELNDIPDLGKLDLQVGQHENLIRLITSQNANEFRKWFHNRENLDEKEIFKEYVNLLHEIPSVGTLPSKTIRFCIGKALDLIPIVGHVASFVDTFLLEEFMKGNSPKYFIEDLRQFRGQIQKYPQGFGKSRPRKSKNTR
jgi:hypothetical protein